MLGSLFYLNGTNRDINATQEITRDQTTGMLDGSVTVDHRLLTDDGLKEIIQDHKDVANAVKDTVAVVKKGGTVVIEAAKSTKRILQNDPAKLPTITTSAGGYIKASIITENGKIIDPPKDVLDKQKQLLDNKDKNATGVLREDIADSYFKNSGYTKLESKCGSNCFDGVYTKNGEIYIVEVKPLSRNAINLSSNKNSPNDIGVQMSDKWIKSRVLALSDTGNIEAIKTAKLIDKAVKQGTPINKIVVGVNDSRAITLNLGNKVAK